MNAMEGRIMEAVADYGKWCGTSRWVEVSEERRAMFAHIAALVAEACDPQPERVCRWREDDDGVWWSACGQGWCFEGGGLAENDVRFCQGCGEPVEVAEGREVTDAQAE